MTFVPITLKAELPPGYPALPDIAAQIVEATIVMYGASAFTPPWIGYLAFEDGQWVGTCAFKSAPIEHRVEIAYFTFPDHEGRGVATCMARELIEIVQTHLPRGTAVAQTLPEANASTHILQKLGFAMTESKVHPEDGPIWEWEWHVAAPQ